MDFMVSLVSVVALCGVLIQLPSAEAELSFSMPESCKSKNMNFCFDNSNYPHSITEKVVSDIKNFEVAKDNDVGEIGYRDGFDENDCRTKSTFDPIYYIVDESGKDRVVLQVKDKFEQRYSVMWCDNEGRITSRTQHFLQSTVMDNKMSCKNKYMNYDFIVLSLKPDSKGNWKMERVSANIPVCCACTYENDY